MVDHIFVIPRLALYHVVCRTALTAFSGKQFEEVVQQVLVAEHWLTIEHDWTNVQGDALHLGDGLPDEHAVEVAVIARHLGQRVQLTSIYQLTDARGIVHGLML